MFRPFLFVFLAFPLVFSCAQKISVVSCTSQVHYPGTQEQKPFQQLVLELDNPEEYSIDSLRYGNQTIAAKGSGSVYRFKATGETPEESALLYYRKKNKELSISIDSISLLKPMYLP